MTSIPVIALFLSLSARHGQGFPAWLLSPRDSCPEVAIPLEQITRNRRRERVRRLAGPYARLVLHAAHKSHVPARLVAAVAYVENAGNFRGAASRVSPAGAIGPMQLMPVTADVLHVDPWNPRQNIEGGARFLAMLLHEFHNTRLALMAYNAGPTWIAQGGRPEQARFYAKEVLHYAHT